MLAYGFRAGGLIDAHGADRTAVLFQDVGPDPADVL
jgi:hypothetical protein